MFGSAIYLYFLAINNTLYIIATIKFLVVKRNDQTHVWGKKKAPEYPKGAPLGSAGLTPLYIFNCSVDAVHCSNTVK